MKKILFFFILSCQPNGNQNNQSSELESNYTLPTISMHFEEEDNKTFTENPIQLKLITSHGLLNYLEDLASLLNTHSTNCFIQEIIEITSSVLQERHYLLTVLVKLPGFFALHFPANSISYSEEKTYPQELSGTFQYTPSSPELLEPIVELEE